MRKRKRDLPFRILKRLMGGDSQPEAQPSVKPQPPQPMPEPPAWLKQDDHSGHDHSHDHDHGHSHDHDDTEEEAPQPAIAEPAKTNVIVDAIETPNPNAIKFSTNLTLTDSSFSASSIEEAKKHPLAEAIFVHDGVKNVFGVNDFVTVLKSEESDWSDLEQPIIESIIKTLSK